MGTRRLFGAAGLSVLVSGLIVNVYLAVVARSLTPAEYAGFGAFWGVALVVGFGAFLPLEQELAHRLPQPQDRRGVLRSAAGAALALAGLSIAMLTALSWIVLPSLDGNLSSFAALLVLCVVSAGQFLVRGTLIGTDRLVRHGAIMVLDSILRLGSAVVVFVAGGGTGTAFCWALVAAIAVAHLPQLPAVWRRAVDPAAAPGTARATRITTRDLLRSAVPLLAGSACAQLLLNGLPVLVVANAATSEQAAVGVFVAAFTLARAPLAMVVPLQSAVVPTLTRLIAADRRSDLAIMLAKGSGALAAVAVVGVPLAWWAGPTLIRLVLGKDYLIAGPDLALITCGVLAYVALVVVTQVHVARSRPPDVALSWTVALGVAAVTYWAVPGPVLNAEVAFLSGALAGALTSGAILLVGRRRGAGGCGRPTILSRAALFRRSDRDKRRCV